MYRKTLKLNKSKTAPSIWLKLSGIVHLGALSPAVPTTKSVIFVSEIMVQGRGATISPWLLSYRILLWSLCYNFMVNKLNFFWGSIYPPWAPTNSLKNKNAPLKFLWIFIEQYETLCCPHDSQALNISGNNMLNGLVDYSRLPL